MNRKAGKLNSLLRMVLIGLCCTASIYAAIYPDDPNTPAKSEVLRREIMESQIQPIYLSITSVTETDLDALINNLSRLEVPDGKASEPQDSATMLEEPQEPVEKAPLPEPKAKTAASEEKTPTETKEASEIIVPDPKWLRQIDEVGQPVNPIALGDVMFKMNQLERAERFYRLVLEKTTSPEDSDWQWAMYQRANCLRRNKPSEARKLYVELLEKAPGSSWSGSASAQLATLNWYASEQASKLENYLSDPNSMP